MHQHWEGTREHWEGTREHWEGTREHWEGTGISSSCCIRDMFPYKDPAHNSISCSDPATLLALVLWLT